MNKRTTTALIILVLIGIASILLINNGNDSKNAIKVKYIGKMLVPRAFHKAVLLDEGNVFIIGGFSNRYAKHEGELDGRNAEIFNFNTGKSILFPHKSTLNLLYSNIFKVNNKIVVVDPRSFAEGKNRSGFDYGLEVFDLKSNAVRLLKVKPEKRFPSLTKFNNTILPNGNILFWGGKKASENNVHSDNNLEPITTFEIFDIEKDTKKVYSANNLDLIGSTIIPIDSSTLQIVGGFDEKENYIANARNFNLTTKKMNVVAKLNKEHISPKVYAFGNDLLIVDENKQVLNEDSWPIYAELPEFDRFKKVYTLKNIEFLTNGQSKDFDAFIPPMELYYQVIGSVRISDDIVIVFTYNNNYIYVNRFSHKDKRLSYLSKYKSKVLNPEFTAIDKNTILISGGMITNSIIPLSHCFLDQICSIKQPSDNIYLLEIRKEIK